MTYLKLLFDILGINIFFGRGENEVGVVHKNLNYGSSKRFSKEITKSRKISLKEFVST